MNKLQVDNPHNLKLLFVYLFHYLSYNEKMFRCKRLNVMLTFICLSYSIYLNKTSRLNSLIIESNLKYDDIYSSSYNCLLTTCA